MPPKRVDDCRCANFSYGNGPTRFEKSCTISPARANGPGLNDFCSGAVYTVCGTHRCSSASPQSVSPRSYATSGAAAMTIKYAGMRRLSRQTHSFFGEPSRPRTSRVDRSLPFATTVCDGGAITRQVTVALSLGWSMLGIQCRARLGQLSAKYVQRPAESRLTIKPSTTVPP